jgi:hypothetical protein
MRTKRLWLVASALPAFLASAALAYIPPASFLLDRLAYKRTQTGVHRLKVKMQCQRGQPESTEHNLYLKVSGLVRREHGKDAVEVCKSGKCWLKRGDAKPQALPSWAYLPYLYFVEGEAKGSRYLGLLESLKVNTKVDAIVRFHSRVAVVLGAKSWERDRPQFWLDKDRFVPLRLMLLDGKSLIDIQWIEWGTKTGGDWFPSVMEIRKDGTVIERCEVDEVATGVSMPEDLFKL